MKNISSLLLCLLLVSGLMAQDSLSTELVKKYTYTLAADGRLSGAGWDSLRKDVAASQFVLLGENHSSPKLSELAALLLKELQPLGYRHFIIETGPVASEKLRHLYDKDVMVYNKRLRDFLTRYKLAPGTPPSEFIAMPTDPLMYHAAISSGYSIKGIDKEYLGSYQYLFEALLPFCTTKYLRNLQQQSVQQLKLYDSLYLGDKQFTRVLHMEGDSIIQRFLRTVSVSSKASFIAEQVKLSWRIYGLYESKRYYESEQVRIALLKRNFGTYYYAHQQQPFKAFIKYGNVHTERGDSYLGYLDLGNMISELAALNGTRSLHIQNMRRYRYD